MRNERRKTITSLEFFEKEKTFVSLYERALVIKQRILQARKIHDFPNEMRDLLGSYQIEFGDLMAALIDDICVLYRSMFQSAHWEDRSVAQSISTKAYWYTADQKIVHNNVLNRVNQVLTHQDLANIENTISYRYVRNEHGEERLLVGNFVHVHIDSLLPLVHRMLAALDMAHEKKYGRTVVERLLMSGH